MGRGRAPCCDKVGLNRGLWTPQEDMRLIAYIQKHGHANWRALPKQAGLLRCGKSCRLRWINYLRPDLKRGNFTVDEEETIIKLHGLLGNKWSKIAACLPGRTDNEIKNVWNTHLKKKAAQREQPKAGSTKEDGAAPITSSSASSSTSTANSSGDVGEQCGTSQEPDAIPPPLETDIDISGMLVDAFPAMAAPMPPQSSPCSSSTLTTSSTCVGGGGVEDLIELPVIDIELDIWDIIDGAADVPDVWGAGHGDATVPCTGATVSTSEAGEGEASDWWLENLERELGLCGPPEDSRAQSDLLLADTEGDPVSNYFQNGPAIAELSDRLPLCYDQRDESSAFDQEW